MIHGGGHITLTRRHIRPHQAAFLLAHAILPVSIDYRLCPEANLIAGPMADVASALTWARTTLPHLAAPHNILLDPSKLAVLGWSSGGHLALTTAWTTDPPPAAILSFYAPIDFASGELETLADKQPPPPGMGQLSLADIARQLHGARSLTGYDVPGGGGEAGWMAPGDARAELVCALFRERGLGLRVVLNGLDSALRREPVDAARVEYVSPVAQARAGRCRVPTFVVHGERDEVVPFGAAERFVREVRARGGECGWLPVQGARHLHDLAARPGSRAWERGVLPGLRFLVDAVGSG